MLKITLYLGYLNILFQLINMHVYTSKKIRYLFSYISKIFLNFQRLYEAVN